MEWENYGDVNFFEYGGLLVRKDTEIENAYEFIWLYRDDEDEVIVASGWADISDYLAPEDKDRIMVNEIAGNRKDFIPTTENEKKNFLVDLVQTMGVHEFSPDFPEETGCSCYALGTVNDWYVPNDVAKRFLREHDVPEEYAA